jgi:hypothetical protein
MILVLTINNTNKGAKGEEAGGEELEQGVER